VTPDELRQQAAQADQRAAESWERSDTDGFVSQWAHGMTADRDRLQARIIEEGDGTWTFPALFTTDGRFVPARVLEPRQYGWGKRWMVLDASGRATGTFLPYQPKRRATLASKGYCEGIVRRPAMASIEGRGHGLSGSAWVAIVPTDNPWDEPAAIITADRWESEVQG
jgi:hypothetical protein